MNINKKLLKWYYKNKRELPWRKKSKEDLIDSYYVWISEIMLQQTTVNTVIPYFNKFIQRFPNIHILASSSISEVLKYWAGLGYYARARNLHKTAKIIVKRYNGVFPKNIVSLLELPGIGDYTAGAILSIAFNKVAFPVDVNIKRVVQRLSNKHEANKKDLTQYLDSSISRSKPGDFIEALMDLGSQICKSSSPKCELCPLNKNCETFLKNKSMLSSKKINYVKKPKKYGLCLIIERTKDQKYFFIRRPEEGLYGGMLSLPTSNWVINKKLLSKEKVLNFDGLSYKKDKVVHVFSHFQLELFICYKKDLVLNEMKGKWIKKEEARSQLPSLMKKVLDKFIH